ncbi:gliding motility-associated C-terminal domain-containing protein [Reichenbachiella agariperforans]|uniref:Gliding motility-associated C-terminal domain-containing protein n=1 Tax=Reichenbachiella agariperforans TaxID=156994 RepID=A0A1M6JST2_REIAG|nr:gliding motility-associated C-terminal domain-containing protein [Reichenbachiella agariperforans]
MKILFSYILLVLLCIQVHAQVSIESMLCKVTKPLTSNQRIELASQFSAWQATKATSLNAPAEVKTIPLVFHVISPSVPSVAEVEEAIVQLNDAYSNKGQFETNGGADMEIIFDLARTAPDGGATTGINHIPTDYTNMDMDLEDTDLVNHSHWDQSKYLNIWLVNSIEGEALADYTGRSWWTRSGVGGYANGAGVVVTSLTTSLVAHEIGHYLGLFHTWEGRNCKNDDCLLDGDMVCDTPPDKSTGGCNDNSCHTDTLSNYSNNTFFIDTLDMSTNFMDYSSCPLDFSLGQKERMHFTLDSSYPTLSVTGRTTSVLQSPCTDVRHINFYMDRQYPIPNEEVLFQSNTMGNTTNYRWFVTPSDFIWKETDPRVGLVSTLADLRYTFPNEGDFKVTVQAWDASDSTCLASFSRYVRVGCGVDARFYPDIRVIASKQPHALMTDSVRFTNRSYNATSYKWTISHQNFDSTNPSLPDTTSDLKDLHFYFEEPGEYEISLTAINGACEDQSNVFNLKVFDPTMEGSPYIEEVLCSSADTLLVLFSLSNNGYDTINVGTPVAFYDRDPRYVATANLMGTYTLPGFIYGGESNLYSAVLAGDITAIDELFVSFNDTGTVDLPIQYPPDDRNQLSTQTIFPPSGYSELTYSNNVNSYKIDVSGFTQERDTIVCDGQVIGFDFEDMFDPSFCSDTVFWVSEHKGYLSSDLQLNYLANEDDLINVVYRSVSGMEILGIINVRLGRPSFDLSDTVYRVRRGEGVTLKIEGDSSYQYNWTPEEGLSDPYGMSPFASPEQNTRYTVEAVDQYGCITLAKQVQVWVETTAHLPNLFTPNGDHSNDHLLIYGLESIIDVSFKIWTKNGVVVFASNDLVTLTKYGWDGKYRGKPLPSGVFFWGVSGTYEDGNPIYLNGVESGVIHLAR